MLLFSSSCEFGPAVERSCYSSIGTSQMHHLPLVTAHDGCEHSTPHTLDAVVGALGAGADVVEIDVRATRDGVIVLQHDGSITVDGQPVELAKLSFGELVELHNSGSVEGAWTTGGITRLEEILVFASSQRFILNLDIKEDSVIEPAVRLIRKQGMIDRVVFTGCEAERARYLKTHHRDCQVLLNISESDYERGTRDYDSFVQSVCANAIETSCCGLNVYYTYCSEALVDHASRRFLPVSVWTVDDSERMRYFLELGVYSITTNEVAALKALMATTGPRGC